METTRAAAGLRRHARPGQWRIGRGAITALAVCLPLACDLSARDGDNCGCGATPHERWSGGGGGGEVVRYEVGSVTLDGASVALSVARGPLRVVCDRTLIAIYDSRPSPAGADAADGGDPSEAGVDADAGEVDADAGGVDADVDATTDASADDAAVPNDASTDAGMAKPGTERRAVVLDFSNLGPGTYDLAREGPRAILCSGGGGLVPEGRGYVCATREGLRAADRVVLTGTLKVRSASGVAADFDVEATIPGRGEVSLSLSFDQRPYESSKRYIDCY